MKAPLSLPGPLAAAMAVLAATGGVDAAQDLEPPAVLAVTPAAGRVAWLTNVVVVFSEPVTGLEAGDLLLNGVAADFVSGSNHLFSFSFEQPPYGTVRLAWAEDHEITDLATPPNPFDASGPGASWQYDLVDVVAPTIVALTPAPGATVRRLTQLEVRFSEAVVGVEAADLVVNGQPAAGLTNSGPDRWCFAFPQPAAGLVGLAWATNHGIQDVAAQPNAFAGGPWTCTLDPWFELPRVRINEFLAGNETTNSPLDLDEEGELQDWIELHNFGTTAVDLAGCSLTDDANDPGRWVFPAVNLAPGGFLLVYASGKDRRTVGGTNRLHTNFPLGRYHDYLALFNGEFPRVALTEFSPEYPEQRNDYSFGQNPSNEWRYFAAPTPGATNGDSAITGVVPCPHVNVRRGLFEHPFTLVVTPPLPDAAVRYTMDSSEPSVTSGTLYTQPLLITNTLTFRVAAFRENLLPSRVETHTYLFLDQVLRQSTPPPGYPAGPTAWTTYAGVGTPSDYEMDPEIVTNAAYQSLLKPALLAIPSVCLTLKVDDLFGAANGIYMHPDPPLAQRNRWERPCSFELIFPEGAAAAQADAGVRIHGNVTRNAQSTPKHPFRLLFKGKYGAGRLTEPVFPDAPVASFNTLVLRAEYGNYWLHTDGNQRRRTTRVRDPWMKDTFRAMGHLAVHSRPVHLYLNGLYWGLYDLNERVDAAFAASYLGGTPQDYDAITTNPDRAIDGDLGAFIAMTNTANLDLSVAAHYTLLGQRLDLTNFVDYMLLYAYAGHNDWGAHQNWNVFDRRAPGEPIRFSPWDCERIFEGVNDNKLNLNNVPLNLHPKLTNSPEYRLLFADRVQRHLFHEGALTTNAITRQWLVRQAQVDLPIIADSARWGDFRRDVWAKSSGPYELYTRNDHWLAETGRVLTNVFPVRHGLVLQQLRNAGLYPAVAAPQLNQQGGRVERGFALSLSAPNPIWYTLDGSDPRVSGSGGVSSSARGFTNGLPLALTNSVTVKARALAETTWSALTEATFVVQQLGVPLRVTEIHYQPQGSAVYEFLEIQNVGDTVCDLSGYVLEGLGYLFPAGRTLAPGAVSVLASGASPTAFVERYPGVGVSDWFDGSLANGGERIAIRDRAGHLIISVDYAAAGGWPVVANGQERSLEIVDPLGDPDDPANWRASAVAGGTPGIVSPPLPVPWVRLNEVLADNVSAVANDGAFPDWIELHNTGTNDVDLAGWSLGDDGGPRQFVFPPNTPLPAGGFLMVWCDTNFAVPGLHAGFALGRKGDCVYLWDAAAARVDAVCFGLQVPDRSLGRVDGDWTLTLPTPGATNIAAPLAAATNLVLNEWLADPPPGQDDWLELHNRASLPVALRGCVIATSQTVQPVASLSFIPAGGFAQWIADEGVGPDHLDLTLPGSGGELVLYDAGANQVDRVTYTAQTEGVSQGRLPDGADTITPFVGTASPGAPNYLNTWAGPVFSEILARQVNAVTNAGPAADFVELWNPAPADFALDGLSLSVDGLPPGQWLFPAGTILPAGGFLVVWCDHGRPPSRIAGDFNTGHALDADSGSARLFNAAGQLVDSIEWGPQVADLSIGRHGGHWRLLAAPTPGASNAAPHELGDSMALRLNEWMAAPTSGPDWFELWNATNLPVELSGLYLGDAPSVSGLTQFPIPPLSFIGARSWATFIADGDPNQGRHHVNFSLDADGEALVLARTNGASVAVLDAVAFGAQMPGISQGRLPDGDALMVDFPGWATPGAANDLPVPPQLVSPPTNQLVLLGSNAVFSVVVANPLPSNYQWSFNGADLPGETSATLVRTNIGFADKGVYMVRVSNRYGVVSASASLQVAILPVILQQPLSQTVAPGQRVTLSVGISGHPPPFGYEWRLLSTPLVSNVSAFTSDFFSFIAPAVPTQQNFRVVVRNAAKPVGISSWFATITVAPDTDGDGLPDSWELAHGFPTNRPGFPAEDADGDGQSDYQEYLAGTNPTNAASRFEVAGVSFGPGRVVLQFHATANRTYAVDGKASLAAPAWTRLTNRLALPTAEVHSVILTWPQTTNGFYRLGTPAQP